MSPSLLLLLLPTLATARIHINVVAQGSQMSVEYFGSSLEVVSDGEARSFGLTDSVMKSAAEKFSGGRPADVFLKSPTPWNDLYKTYGWREVRRMLFPRSAKILGIRAEPVILTTHEFVNNSTFSAIFSAEITQQVQDTVTSTWTKGGDLTVGQAITYSVKAGVAEIGGTTSISFTASWGEDHSSSKSVTVGSTSGIEVALKPGQAAVASLTATRGTMEVQVDYRANLNGDLACNYPRRFNGHHFWRYDLNKVQEESGLRQYIDSSEIIRIGFYSDAKVVVSDKSTKRMLTETYVPINLAE